MLAPSPAVPDDSIKAAFTYKHFHRNNHVAFGRAVLGLCQADVPASRSLLLTQAGLGLGWGLGLPNCTCSTTSFESGLVSPLKLPAFVFILLVLDINRS